MDIQRLRRLFERENRDIPTLTALMAALARRDEPFELHQPLPADAYIPLVVIAMNAGVELLDHSREILGFPYTLRFVPMQRGRRVRLERDDESWELAVWDAATSTCPGGDLENTARNTIVKRLIDAGVTLHDMWVIRSHWSANTTHPDGDKTMASLHDRSSQRADSERAARALLAVTREKWPHIPVSLHHRIFGQIEAPQALIDLEPKAETRLSRKHAALKGRQHQGDDRWGHRLRRERQRQGWSQKDLAACLDLSTRALRHLEQRHTPPDDTLLIDRIRHILRQPLDDHPNTPS